MELRNLGRTGVQVSSLCLGCMMFGRRTEPEESYAIIDRALDAGVNFLDTANVYAAGRSEEITGEALKRNGRRQHVVLATKVHGSMDADDPNARGNSRRHIIEQCEASLRRLQTDYIDLYQLHRPQADIPWGPLGGGLLTGKYRRGEPLPEDGRYATNPQQARRLTEGVYDVVEGLEPIAAEKGCTLSQLALAWCEQQPGVTSPIIGPRTLEQIEDNLGASEVTITDEDRERIDAVIAPGRTVSPYYEAGWRPHEYRIL